MSYARENNFSLDIYPIQIKKKDDLFYLFCSTFGIVESDKSLDSAYEKLNNSRSVTSAKLQSFGIDTTQYQVNKRRPIFNRFTKIFALIILILLPFGLISGYLAVTNKISKMISSYQQQINQKINSVFLDTGKIVVGLNMLSSTLDRMTPERKIELKNTLHKLTSQLKPFADEVKPLYNDK